MKKAINIIKDIVDVAAIQINRDGLSIRAMDASNVCFVDYTMDATAFDKFSCRSQMMIGVSMNTLHKVFKCIRPESALVLQVNGDKLTIIGDGEKSGAEFELNILESQHDSLDIPAIDYEVLADFSAAEFHNIVQHLGHIDDSVDVTAEAHKMSFRVANEGIAGGTSIVETDDEAGIKVSRHTQDVALSFSLKYLSKFTPAQSISSRVTFGMHSQNPLQVLYAVDKTKLCFHLAPKIQS